MRSADHSFLAIVIVLLGVAPLPGAPPRQPAWVEDDIKLVHTSGLKADGPNLVEFFRARSRGEIDVALMATWVRDLGDPAPAVHRRAAQALVSCGAVAMPWLRKGINDLENPEVARRARRCLEAIEGAGGAALSAAAARVLAMHRPAEGAEALLAYLPYAEDASVIEAITTALATMASESGKPTPALLRALTDPVPARRAVAAEALCRADAAEAGVRKLLRDPNPAVRLRASLALARQNDIEAIPVLIDLTAELPPEQRKQVEEVLQELAGDWAPALPAPGTDDISRRIRRDVWLAWWRNTDGPALLTEFRKRTLTPDTATKVRALVRKLGDESYDVRESAARDLVALGSAVIPLLRQALRDADPEVARRASGCLDRLEQGEKNPLPVAAARLVALRKPSGAAQVLLDYLPFADEEMMAGVQSALGAIAIRDGKPDPALVQALEDRDAVKRSAAGQALARAADGDARAAVRRLLKDGDETVRLRVGIALAQGQDREAVPVLIDLLRDLPADLAWQAHDVLGQIAGERAPSTDLGRDAASRRKCHEAWVGWWRQNGARADLSRLRSEPLLLGYTLVVLVDNNGMGRVVELGRDGKPRWQIDGLQYPVDAWVLPGNRVLIGEYNGNRVTERDLKGNVLWEKRNFPALVVNAQRLPNGHTFIATQQQLMIVDRNGNEVFSNTPAGGVWSAHCSRKGEITYFSGNQCVRMDAKGKELNRFAINSGGSWTSGIDVTPRGRVIVPQHNANKVAEYDTDGKVVWEADAPQITTATQLANGHVLVASYNNQNVTEIDRHGKVVWEHKDTMHPFRARRR